MLGYAAKREPSELFHAHMGRSEAPLKHRDPREETPGGANRKQLAVGGSKMRFAAETHKPRPRGEKLRGVESKFNERDPSSLTGNSIQTTLLSTSL